MAVVALAVVLLLAGQAVRAQSDEEARNLASSQAYVTMVRGDSARSREQAGQAERYYRKALSLYQALKQQYPGWQPDVFDLRIAYCANQIEALESRQDEAGRVSDADESVEAEMEVLRSKNSALAGENNYLRQRIAELDEEMSQVEEVAGADDSLFNLQTENAGLREELRAVQEASAQTSGDAQELAALRAQVSDLQAKLDAAAKDASLRRQPADRQGPPGEAEALRAEVENLRAAQDAALSEQAGMKNQLTDLGDELGRLRTRNAELEAISVRMTEAEGDLVAEVEALRTERQAGGSTDAQANTDEMERTLASLRADYQKSLEERARLEEDYAGLQQLISRQAERSQSTAALEAELGNLRAESEQTTMAHDRLSAANTELRASLDEWAGRADAAESEVARLSRVESALRDMTADRDRIHQEGLAHQASARELQERLVTSTASLADAKALVGALEAQEAAQREQKARLGQERNALARELEVATARLRELDASLKTSRQTHAQLERATNRLREQLDRAVRGRDRLDERAQRDSGMVRELRIKNRELWAVLKDAEQRADSLGREVKETATYTKELTMLRNERAALKSEKQALELELEAAAHLRAQKDELQQALRDLEERFQALTN